MESMMSSFIKNFTKMESAWPKLGSRNYLVVLNNIVLSGILLVVFIRSFSKFIDLEIKELVYALWIETKLVLVCVQNLSYSQ